LYGGQHGLSTFRQLLSLNYKSITCLTKTALIDYCMSILENKQSRNK
jgi:hypothetical protein